MHDTICRIHHRPVPFLPIYMPLNKYRMDTEVVLDLDWLQLQQLLGVLFYIGWYYSFHWTVNFAGNAPIQYACWFEALVFVKKWYMFIEPLCRCVSFVSYHQSCQSNLQNQYSFTDTHDGCLHFENRKYISLSVLSPFVHKFSKFYKIFKALIKSWIFLEGLVWDPYTIWTYIQSQIII